jgi:hypothetical protein
MKPTHKNFRIKVVSSYEDTGDLITSTAFISFETKKQAEEALSRANKVIKDFYTETLDATTVNDVNSPIYCLQALLEEVSRPLPQSQLETLAQEIFPEVRQIASASCLEEREKFSQQLTQRLLSLGSQDGHVLAPL